MNVWANPPGNPALQLVVLMAAGYTFGKVLISPRIVFLQTGLSYAFTNRKPVVPGRILCVI